MPQRRNIERVIVKDAQGEDVDVEIKAEILQGDVERFYEADADIRSGLLDESHEQLADELLKFTQAMKGVDGERFKALLAEFSETMRAQRRIHGAELRPARANGVTLRAACRSGIVLNLKESDVENLRPYQVTKLTTEIWQILSAAFEVPGE